MKMTDERRAYEAVAYVCGVGKCKDVEAIERRLLDVDDRRHLRESRDNATMLTQVLGTLLVIHESNPARCPACGHLLRSDWPHHRTCPTGQVLARYRAEGAES